MYCWQLLLREVEAPDGTSTVVQNKEVCVKHHRQYSNLVDRSDLIVCCIQRKSGGAYKTMQYAEKRGKCIINLADN